MKHELNFGVGSCSGEFNYELLLNDKVSVPIYIYISLCMDSFEVRDLLKSITFVLIELRHLKYQYICKIIPYSL